MASTNIRVIGIGGGGGNAIDRMMQCKLKGIELIAVNTDIQDLKKVRAHKKLHIGNDVTGGMGAGMNPDLGKKAAQESLEQISELLAGTEMVFLTAGLGGGTGGGAIPVIAELAKKQGILTIAVVTKPFSFEGAWRMRLADRALENLKGRVDTLLVIPNDHILEMSEEDTQVVSAFWKADEVLRQAVQGISDLITLPGIINVDFADMRSIMKNSGRAVFGTGKAKGESRIELALDQALNSPLLNLSIEGAKGVLFNMAGAKDMSLVEVDEAAKIIFGAVMDKSLKIGEIKITVIATGFSK